MTLCGGTLLVDDAEALVADYLDPGHGFAWPAYDTLETNGSSTLVTGDLLAPTLLEAHVDPSRFRVLSEMLPELQSVAALPPVALHDADDATIDAVAGLFAVLDTPHYHRRGIRGTIVSKVLHRKRPDLVPLYDSRIDAAYRASGQVPHETHRSWQQFMGLICRLMRADLQRHSDVFTSLQVFARGRGAELTWLRILDICIWMSLEDL